MGGVLTSSRGVNAEKRGQKKKTRDNETDDNPKWPPRSCRLFGKRATRHDNGEGYMNRRMAKVEEEEKEEKDEEKRSKNGRLELTRKEARLARVANAVALSLSTSSFFFPFF